MKIAWKEIIHQPKKFFLIELLIFLMMFMVIFLTGLTNGLGRAVSGQIENYGDLNYILSDDSEDIITFSNFNDKQKDFISKSNLDNLTSFSIQRSGITYDAKEGKQDVSYFAIDNPNGILKAEIIEGENISDKEMTVVLNNTFKEDGVKIGDTIKDVSSDLELEVVGFTKDSMYGHSPVAFINSKTFENIRKKNNPQYSFSPQAYVSKQSFNDQDIEEFLNESLIVLSKDQVVSKIPGYAAEQTTLSMIVWVLLLVAAAILGVFFYILTLQKLKQFGVLKALGMTMGEISKIQISQIFLLSLIGVGIGQIVAIGLGQILPSSMPFHLEYINLLIVSISFIAISLVCGILSLFKIRKVDPVQVIGGNEN